MGTFMKMRAVDNTKEDEAEKITSGMR